MKYSTSKAFFTCFADDNDKILYCPLINIIEYIVILY